MSKKDRAKQIVEEAIKSGCKPSISGDWIVWTPPLPVELMLESMSVSKEMHEHVSKLIELREV